MKRIGAGWQYVVYSLGNGRVLKRPRPMWEQVPIIATGLLATHPARVLTLHRELSRIRKDTYESAALTRRFLTRIDPALFGNPEFIDEVSFSQDYAKPLGACFRNASTKEKEELFAGYVALMECMWEYGIGETVFNFSINCGRSSDGSIVQIDLGELTDSKERMLDYIERSTWKTQFSFLTLPGDLRKYAMGRMAQAMTKENLERHWAVRGAG